MIKLTNMQRSKTWDVCGLEWVFGRKMEGSEGKSPRFTRAA